MGKTISNWGIVGTGNIVETFVHDLPFVSSPQQAIALWGHKEDSAKETAEKLQIPAYYTDIDQLIAHPGIDAIYIASPHTFHFKQTLAALKKGIPVLCEKPLSVNAEECEQLIQTAREHQVFLMDGMWIRFLPSIQTLLSLLQRNAIGKIRTVKAGMCFKAPRDPDHRLFDPDLGGGALLDMGVYTVFVMQLVLGRPLKITAMAQLSDQDVDEMCSIICNYGEGQQAVLHASIMNDSQLPAEITGDDGTIQIHHPWFEKSPRITWTPNEGEVKHYDLSWEGHGLHYEIEEVIRCVKEGAVESVALSHQFSLDMLETMDAIRKQIGVTYKND